MVRFTATIKKFGSAADKTGWSFIEVPAKIAVLIKDSKKSFRVKGKIDDHPIEQVSLLPMGEGNFIIPMNAGIRKGIRKIVGATVELRLSEDKKEFEISPELMECLADEPAALAFFDSLTPSHQRYFSKWITSAKTEETKAKRIARCVSALFKKMDYGAMLRGEDLESLR